MTIEIEVLSELYMIMKQYVVTKDRQECADNVMSGMVDMLDDESIQTFGDTDQFLRRSLKEYFDNQESDDEDGEEE
jgi:hypothetical protein